VKGLQFVRWNLLCLVGGNGRRVDSIADASDAATNDELSRSSTVWWHTSNLNDNTKEHDSSAQEDGLAAAELVADEEDQEGAQEAAHGVDGNNEALVSTVAVNLGKCGDECGGGNDTAHDPLVITKEQEVGNGDDCDEKLEHRAGLPPVGGHTGVVVLYFWHGE
jgi:hypothetical protein